jgi:hypothetical protein
MIEGFAHDLRVDAALEQSSGEGVPQVAHPDVAKHELRDEPSELMRDRLDGHRHAGEAVRPVPLWPLMSVGSSQDGSRTSAGSTAGSPCGAGFSLPGLVLARAQVVASDPPA